MVNMSVIYHLVLFSIVWLGGGNFRKMIRAGIDNKLNMAKTRGGI